MALSKKHKRRIREEEEYRAKVQKEVAPKFTTGKSKVAAALLAFFLGDFGIHKFYLGKNGQGVVYLLLSITLFWTVIVPFIITIVCWLEALSYITTTDEEFEKQYH